MTRRELFLLPFVATVAIAGVVVGSLALTKAPPSNVALRAQIDSDRSELVADTAQLTRDRDEIARLGIEVATLRVATAHAASADNVTALRGAVTNIDATLNRYALCVPQIMRYVNGMQPTGSWVHDTAGNKLLTYPVSVSSTVPISGACAWLLNGPPRG